MKNRYRIILRMSGLTEVYTKRSLKIGSETLPSIQTFKFKEDKFVHTEGAVVNKEFVGVFDDLIVWFLKEDKAYLYVSCKNSGFLMIPVRYELVCKIDNNTILGLELSSDGSYQQNYLNFRRMFDDKCNVCTMYENPMITCKDIAKSIEGSLTNEYKNTIGKERYNNLINELNELKEKKDVVLKKPVKLTNLAPDIVQFETTSENYITFDFKSGLSGKCNIPLDYNLFYVRDDKFVHFNNNVMILLELKQNDSEYILKPVNNWSYDKPIKDVMSIGSHIIVNVDNMVIIQKIDNHNNIITWTTLKKFQFVRSYDEKVNFHDIEHCIIYTYHIDKLRQLCSYPSIDILHVIKEDDDSKLKFNADTFHGEISHMIHY